MNKPIEDGAQTNLRDLGATLGKLWWQFFDWIALLSWPKMILLCILAMMVAGMLGLPAIFFLAIIATAVMKVLAGGKRRAEVAAGAATERANVEMLERRLLEAQIAALQAQVEPHFLFNTLALIGQLIETDPPQAAHIHKHLIAYLRSAVPQMREQGSSTLGRQVELSRAYLAIMQARMKERLSVEIDLPPALIDVPFPPMMLQSVVENAIKHGLEPTTQGGRIVIRASLVGADLQVDVIDNGAGFDPHADDGTGLANIRERLKVLYGGKAQLIIELPPEGGTKVSLRLPDPFNHPNPPIKSNQE
jgi:LytS/YehU family sensor histidine kinase